MKRRTHREALRELLSDGRQHHMSELIKVGGYRYGGRLHELRHDEGLDIRTIRVADDEFCYQLVVHESQLSLV